MRSSWGSCSGASWSPISRRRGGAMSDLRSRRARLALLALALACCGWFYATWEREERKTFRLPVRAANVPPGVVASGLPAEVEVVLAGPRILLADPGLQGRELVLDLAGAGEGEVS